MTTSTAATTRCCAPPPIPCPGSPWSAPRTSRRSWPGAAPTAPTAPGAPAASPGPQPSPWPPPAPALALALTGTLSLSASPAPGTGTVRTAAFTLTSNPNGTATLKINPLELLDTAALQRDLTQYGIPAKVTSGTFCSSSPAPSGFPQVVSINAPWATATPQSGGTVTPPPSGGPPPAITITIDPSAMPAGAALSVGDFLLSSGQQQASLALIDTSAYTCSSTPPGPEGPPGGFQLLYGGPGPAGS